MEIFPINEIDELREQLKPCPFCGSTSIDIVQFRDKQLEGIVCEDCPATMSDIHLTIKALIIKWNTRT